MPMCETSRRLLVQKSPTVILRGEVNRDMLGHARSSFEELLSLGAPAAKVVITSGGGDVGVGLDIYDIIRLYPAPVDALVLSHAASMAAVILQACRKRSCAQNAGILIHHVSRREVSLDELEDDEKRRKLVEHMRTLQQRLYDILAARSKQPIERIREECLKDAFMPAEQAFAFGLIDEIV